MTWDEWFARSMEVMKQVIPAGQHDRLAYRVTLLDGRTFGVKQAMAHVARGTCTIGPSRWNESEAICDVITGYMFLGAGDDELPGALCVEPTSIVSVECLLIPEQESGGPSTPFGFHKREVLDVPVERREVEEKFTYINAEGSD